MDVKSHGTTTISDLNIQCHYPLSFYLIIHTDKRQLKRHPLIFLSFYFHIPNGFFYLNSKITMITYFLKIILPNLLRSCSIVNNVYSIIF